MTTPDSTPLLIFPEGTCVNNEYTLLFKRGAFDMGCTVCPVAIKYNKVLVDAFWNRCGCLGGSDYMAMLCYMPLQPRTAFL